MKVSFLILTMYFFKKGMKRQSVAVHGFNKFNQV